MPDVEYRDGAQSLVEVLAEFDSRKDHFDEVRAATKNLVETILKEVGIGIHSVQARVKSKKKVGSKYCKPDKEYKCLDDMPDVVGLRIITYYSDEIDTIAEIIGREFIEITPREDKRIESRDSFGYTAIHFDCKYLQGRLNSTEYKRFADARFEIQITTILGHAWAEMHHPWYDESDSPVEEVRRFHRLAAVLELADQEFLEVRKKKDNRERSASVRVAAKAPGTPVTSESLMALIEQSELVKQIDSKLAEVRGSQTATKPNGKILKVLVEFLNAVGIGTIQEVEDGLIEREDAIVEFMVRRREKLDGKTPKPLLNYVEGICIFQLATFIAFLRGADAYAEIISKIPITAPSVESIQRQAAIARDVAKSS
jgi:putative GTP pyrophosphokinase